MEVQRNLITDFSVLIIHYLDFKVHHENLMFWKQEIRSDKVKWLINKKFV